MARAQFLTHYFFNVVHLEGRHVSRVEYNVRCLNCDNVKGRSQFRNSNIKVYQDDGVCPRLMPVCNDCHKSLRASGFNRGVLIKSGGGLGC